MPPKKIGKVIKKPSPPPVKTFNEKLYDWFKNNDVQNHQDEIITFITEPKELLTDLDYQGTSVIFWSSRLNYKDILTKALRWRTSSQKVINNMHDNQTALSLSAYCGYHEIVVLLLKSKALIEVVEGDIRVNAYESLGCGFYKRPTDVENYKKTFKAMVLKDPAKPTRKFFSDKYAETGGNAYLACLHLYDHVRSGKIDRRRLFYNKRDILAVEDTAIRRFFRFDRHMKLGGAAATLAAELFSIPPPARAISIKGYSSRSVIIALVHQMKNTPTLTVQNTVASTANFYSSQKQIFSIKFTLDTTQFLYEWRPQKWQRGNCVFMINSEKPEPFGQALAKRLGRLTETQNHGMNDRTQKLGKLFLEKTKELRSFHNTEFIYQNNMLLIRTTNDGGAPVATYDQAKAMIHNLNGLLILWSIVEPARRLSGHTAVTADQVKENEKKSHFGKDDYDVIKEKNALNIDHIPVATMQIRALRLLSEGLIALRDIFGVSEKYEQSFESLCRAEYEVSTAQDVVETFYYGQEKSMRLASISLPRPALASKNSFFSRNYTKQLLREGYGNADESDDDDYSDEDFPDSPFIK